MEKQLALQCDQLKALSGVLPDSTLAEFKLDRLTLPEALPLALPSMPVEHRPDVRAAEEQLRSARRHGRGRRQPLARGDIGRQLVGIFVGQAVLAGECSLVYWLPWSE